MDEGVGWEYVYWVSRMEEIGGGWWEGDVEGRGGGMVMNNE